jgi:hypothetical protein
LIREKSKAARIGVERLNALLAAQQQEADAAAIVVTDRH